jgi:hypothetical protein
MGKLPLFISLRACFKAVAEWPTIVGGILGQWEKAREGSATVSEDSLLERVTAGRRGASPFAEYPYRVLQLARNFYALRKAQKSRDASLAVA